MFLFSFVFSSLQFKKIISDVILNPVKWKKTCLRKWEKKNKIKKKRKSKKLDDNGGEVDEKRECDWVVWDRVIGWRG